MTQNREAFCTWPRLYPVGIARSPCTAAGLAQFERHGVDVAASQRPAHAIVILDPNESA